jgi:hypothetical protein
VSTHHKIQEGIISPLDAFERMCIEMIQIEAVANAASAAMDECEPPPSSEPRRSFHRAHALIGSTAEKAAAATELAEALKASVHAYLEAKRNG